MVGGPTVTTDGALGTVMCRPANRQPPAARVRCRAPQGCCPRPNTHSPIRLTFLLLGVRSGQRTAPLCPCP